MTKKFKRKAFSLAEALITLLIVSMITIAAIPVFTKKRSEKENHGKWICTLDKTTGEHIQWTTGVTGDATNPKNWTVTGTSCTFTPPPLARNFNITAVGGGGGGAGAQSEGKTWTSDFAVDFYGKYKFIAVGGGGGGGKAQCNNSGGAGSGGIGYIEYELDEDVVKVKMLKGEGGNKNETNHNGSGDSGHDGQDGTVSTITVVKKDKDSGDEIDVTIIKAEGGKRGYGRWRNLIGACAGSSGNGGAGGSVSGVSGLKKEEGKKGGDKCGSTYCGGCMSFSTAKTLNKFIGSNLFKTTTNDSQSGRCNIYQIGRGGDATSTRSSFSRGGKDGYVAAITEIYKSGEGGKAAQAREKFVPSFKERQVKVTIGAGGKGGGIGESGKEGGLTNVENYLPAEGAPGGSSIHIEKASTDTPGGDGERTTLYYKSEPAPGYGGISGANKDVNGMTSDGYGAGGGGGGANAEDGAGVGADGSPGYVLIEW